MDNESVIVCNIAMFNMRSHVVFPDNTVEAVSVADLVSYIPQTCHQEGIYKVHFFGNKEYIDGLINQMVAEELGKYAAHNRIIYEVN